MLHTQAKFHNVMSKQRMQMIGHHTDALNLILGGFCTSKYKQRQTDNNNLPIDATPLNEKKSSIFQI